MYYEKGGCLQFSPIGLRLEDVEVIIETLSDKPKHSLEIFYDMWYYKHRNKFIRRYIANGFNRKRKAYCKY